MSEERNKDEEERLKKELNEWIDSLLYFPSWLFAAHGYGAF